MDSMLAGFTRYRSPSTPLISTNGLLPLMELVPRMLMLAPLPGLPEEVVIFSPDALPYNMCVAVDAERSMNSLLETVEMTPVKLTHFCVPYPTTTTSSSVFVKVIFKNDFPFTEIVLVIIPTYETLR